MDAKADKSEVDGIISQLSSGQAKEFVAEDPASLEQYGLKNPSFRVDLFLGEERAKKTLLVGNKTDDKYYARDESRSPVFLVDTTLVSKLDVQLFDLRDKTFTEFNSSEINKFSIQANDTLFVFEKDTSDAWTIVEPVAKKAKNWKVSTMVGAANNLEIKEFVDDQTTNKRVYGLADPAIVGKYYKDDQVVLELSLGNVKGDLVYAARADDDRIVLIDQSTREKMTPDLDEIIDETTTETSSN
jgi:hypothetical protein